MALQFSDLQASIKRKLGANDSSAAYVAAIKRAINDAYMDMVTSHEWPWARREAHFLTSKVLDETDHGNLTPGGAGNITLTAALGDMAVNGVGDGWIVVDDVRRPVKSCIGADATLEAGWPDANPLTSYHLYRLHYVLPTTVRKIVAVSITIDTERRELTWVEGTEFLNKYYFEVDSGDPYRWSVIRATATGELMLAIDPIPDAECLLSYVYYLAPAVMTLDADVPIIPDRWQHVIEIGTMSHLHQDFFHDAAQGARATALFSRQLSLMAKESQPTNRQVYHMGEGPRRLGGPFIDWSGWRP